MSDLNLNVEPVDSAPKVGGRLGNSGSSVVVLSSPKNAANDNNMGVNDVVEVGTGGNEIENENDAAVTTLGSSGKGNGRREFWDSPLLSEIGQKISDGEVQGDIRRRRGSRSRSSQSKGVTLYRRTERRESHSWDEGRLGYLGVFDPALAAPRAYDRAAIKFRGVEADIIVNLSDNETDLMQMKRLTKEEVHGFRRQRTRFSRGSPFGNSNSKNEEHIQSHSGAYDEHSRDSRVFDHQTEDNEIRAHLASSAPRSPETDNFICMDVENGNGSCRTGCRADNLERRVLEWMFVIANLVVELLSLVFEQLSSRHYSLFLPICMGMSLLALFICTLELVYKAQKEGATWRWCGSIPWFYYPSESGIRVGSFVEIAGLACAFGQCLLTTVSYCLFLRDGNNPIKISIWASIFASCQLSSKVCGEFKHDVHGQVTS